MYCSGYEIHMVYELCHVVCKSSALAAAPPRDHTAVDQNKVGDRGNKYLGGSHMGHRVAEVAAGSMHVEWCDSTLAAGVSLLDVAPHS